MSGLAPAAVAPGMGRLILRGTVLLVGLAVLALAVLGDVTPAAAKSPGATYCYRGICHRVKTVAETRRLIGETFRLKASFYDGCTRDRFNPCGLTSSGEAFDPSAPDNAASPVFPNGTLLLVHYPATGEAAVVRVNNTGPFWGVRKLDVSRAVAERLGFAAAGVAELAVQVVSAPEADEAKYVRNRIYAKVAGPLGPQSSLDTARAAFGSSRGFAVAMEQILRRHSAPELPRAPPPALDLDQMLRSVAAHSVLRLPSEAPPGVDRDHMFHSALVLNRLELPRQAPAWSSNEPILLPGWHVPQIALAGAAPAVELHEPLLIPGWHLTEIAMARTPPLYGVRATIQLADDRTQPQELAALATGADARLASTVPSDRLALAHPPSSASAWPTSTAAATSSSSSSGSFISRLIDTAVAKARQGLRPAAERGHGLERLADEVASLAAAARAAARAGITAPEFR